MNYIAVDDEPFALKDLKEAITEADPNADLSGFSTPGKALEYAKNHQVDVAFLDIELGSTNGIVLAKQLKDLWSQSHIIFVTSYEQYAVQAFQLRATGYLMKPVTVEDIRRELTFLYGEQTASEKVQIQTFGGFEVFVAGRPLVFKRAKSKELLAYLVDRKGASVTAATVCAALWGDASVEENKKSYLRIIVKSLRETLREAGIENILIRSWNSMAIVPESLDCDSYKFLEGDPIAVNTYKNNYLIDYGWAEFQVK